MVSVEEAKELIRGGYDIHLHSAPDLLPRKANDIEFARMAKEAGMAGFVLKSHYMPTAERASLVRYVVEGFKAYGGLVLNWGVGGINPVAVEVSAKSGAKVVWMPTIDSINEKGRWTDVNDWSKAPYWAKLSKELKSLNKATPIVIWKGQELREEVYDVLDIIKKYNMILATGHISKEDGLRFIPLASQYGVKRIVVTHPEFPSTSYRVEEQVKLLDYNPVFERCFTTPFSGKTTWDVVIRGIRETGIENNVLSTDLGQPTAPYPVEGMIMFAQKLLEAGFSGDEIHRMIADNPRKLLEE